MVGCRDAGEARYNHFVHSRLKSAILSLAVLAASSLVSSCAGAGPGPDTISSTGSSAGHEPDVVSTSPPPRLTTKELVRQSKPAIVRIISQGPGGVAMGTGFFVEPTGVIVTNLHVIVGAHEVQVQLLDSTLVPLQAILAYDVERDLAILQIAPNGHVPVLSLADSDQVEAGDPVIAIGNPLGVLDYTVSDGLVSSVRPINDKLTLLQISAPISQGSSGGPLFNPKGQVIGVVRAFITEGQNLNFGIPSNYVRDLMQRNQRLSLEAFNAEIAEEMAKLEPESKGTFKRQVPFHDLSVLDGCDQQALETARTEIGGAISVGAPVYNQGNHEACYRIYEGVASKLERESSCRGVRDALGQGLLRASTLDDYTSKAWAMRDAFDGLLHVIARKQGQTP